MRHHLPPMPPMPQAPPPRTPGAPQTRPPVPAPSGPTLPASSRPEPVPWPQVVPAGLPAFPGSAWVPDNPPGPGVVARARALLPVLWRAGAGTFKTEQTAGRWITYRATPGPGGRRDVNAFKLTDSMAAPSAAPPMPRSTVPAAEPPPAPAAPAAPPAIKGVRVLRLGSSGPDVVVFQRMLASRGYPVADDGKFGQQTHNAVRAFQAAQGLTVDGVVGPQTWGAVAVRRDVAS